MTALGRENGLDVRNWLFEPGMRFGARRQWWGSRRQRQTPHEGVDFRFFEDHAGQRHVLGVDTRVVAMYDGVILALFDDFLGQTILVAHDVLAAGKRLHTLYGHCRPAAAITNGSRIGEGTSLGTLSASEGKTTSPHLHLSLAWLTESFAAVVVSWPQLLRSAEVCFIDPLPHMADKHKNL